MLKTPSASPPPHDFRTLVLPHTNALFSRACFLEGGRVEAWDLVQDTLERALRAFHQFAPGREPGSSTRRWLFKIMNNLFVDRYRRRAREVRSLPIEDFDLPAPEPEPATPWEDFDDGELEATMAGLERPFREVLELHFFEQRSYQDIGRSLHIPTATVGTRLMRARNKLRVLMQPAPEAREGQRFRGRGIA